MRLPVARRAPVAEQQQRTAHGGAGVPRAGPVARRRHTQAGTGGVGVRARGGRRVRPVRADGRGQERDARVPCHARRRGARFVVVRGPAGDQQHGGRRRRVVRRGGGPGGQRHVYVRGGEPRRSRRVQLHRARRPGTVRDGRFVPTGRARTRPAGRRVGRGLGVLRGRSCRVRRGMPVDGGQATQPPRHGRPWWQVERRVRR